MHVRTTLLLLMILARTMAGAHPAAQIQEHARFAHITATSLAWGWEAVEWKSSVVLYQNAIYTAWVTPQRSLRIARIEQDGTIETTDLLGAGQNSDDAHNHPSIGIDRSGRLHVAGNMHGNNWNYWRANQPGSIQQFSFLGGPRDSSLVPGFNISYPSFTRDNNGTLYLCFRAQARSGFGPRQMGACMAVYKEGDRGAVGEWQMLGADPIPTDAVALPVMVNSPHGRIPLEGAPPVYQTYRTRGPYFDRTNRLHYAMPIIGVDGLGLDAYATTIAYCTQAGPTEPFTLASGLSAPLPLSESTEQPVIDIRPNDDLATRISVVATVDGRPIVGYNRLGPQRFKRWEGTHWSEELTLPDSGRGDSRIAMSHGGHLLIFSGKTVYSSRTNGDTFERYSLPYPIGSWDMHLFSTTGIFLYTALYDSLYYVGTLQIQDCLTHTTPRGTRTPAPRSGRPTTACTLNGRVVQTGDIGTAKQLLIQSKPGLIKGF